ncbi:unnamed protein product [Adineta ricciae]|uniref:Ubiquitin-like domain-containing protein n=1 Tax=Adineta ricciae TaxID=249248 RepID=A0A815LQA7_ADIRI|nr:unnamed protein product [Adineta ricciae]CAF1420909.1 unnamed protein product [Adineta ricciae]
MGCASSSQSDHIKVKVDMSWPGGRKKIVKRIPVTTTVGQLKQKLNAPNAKLSGHLHKLEYWDNSRPIADYLAQNRKKFKCNLQLSKQ